MGQSKSSRRRRRKRKNKGTDGTREASAGSAQFAGDVQASAQAAPTPQPQQGNGQSQRRISAAGRHLRPSAGRRSFATATGTAAAAARKIPATRPAPAAVFKRQPRRPSANGIRTSRATRGRLWQAQGRRWRQAARPRPARLCRPHGPQLSCGERQLCRYPALDAWRRRDSTAATAVAADVVMSADVAGPIDYSIGRPIPIPDDAPTKIYFFIDDLFFNAKITETARKLGVKVAFVKSGQRSHRGVHVEGRGRRAPGLIVFDLNNAARQAAHADSEAEGQAQEDDLNHRLPLAPAGRPQGQGCGGGLRHGDAACRLLAEPAQPAAPLWSA